MSAFLTNYIIENMGRGERQCPSISNSENPTGSHGPETTITTGGHNGQHRLLEHHLFRSIEDSHGSIDVVKPSRWVLVFLR